MTGVLISWQRDFTFTNASYTVLVFSNEVKSQSKEKKQTRDKRFVERFETRCPSTISTAVTVWYAFTVKR
eukprot:5987917-Amphidinium_carterae.1